LPEEPRDMQIMRQALIDANNIVETTKIERVNYCAGKTTETIHRSVEGQDNARSSIAITLFRYRMHMIENAEIEAANGKT
jgi:hypothetical protein